MMSTETVFVPHLVSQEGREPQLTPRSFWFLRHGTTARNAERLAQGNVEVPMNDRGHAEVREAAQKLRGRGIATIVSSPLGRARESAKAVAAVLGLPVHIHAELREAELGCMDNTPMGPWFDEWITEGAVFPGIEPFSTLHRRAVSAVNACMELPAPVLIVGHGAFFRALRIAMGLQANVRLPNGQAALLSPPGEVGAGWSVTVLI